MKIKIEIIKKKDEQKTRSKINFMKKTVIKKFTNFLQKFENQTIRKREKEKIKDLLTRFRASI